MRQLLAFTLLAALICPAPAHALCALPAMRPKVMTPDVTTTAGGVVVGTEAGYGGTSKDMGDATQPTWAIKTKTGQVKPVLSVLAPGLVAYQLPAKVDAGELIDADKKVLAKLTRAPAPVPKLAAPSPTKITYKLTPGPRGNSELTSVVFGTSVPAEAIALIVVDAKTMTPRSYGLVSAGALEVSVYARGRCSALPNGTSPTVAGDKVILRWVDATGAVSADSKLIVVAKA